MIAAMLITAWAQDAGFDHGYADLEAAYEGAVTDEGVRYGAIDRAKLDAGLGAIAAVDASTFSRDQRLALYVNAYNGYTVRLILDEGQPASIRDLDGGRVWKTRSWTVAGEELTLDALEHLKARPLADGRVHAVLNCASKGCPPLPPSPLTADGIGKQLDAAAARWVRTNGYALDGDTLRISRIFEWFGEDFSRWRVLDHPAATPAQDAALGFLRQYGAVPDTFEKVDWLEYDWSLNAAG